MGAASDLVSKGYGGYAGWGDAEAQADFKATGGSGKWTGGGGGGTPQVQNTQQATQHLNNVQTGSPSSVQDLIAMGYGGYAGWGNTEALADFKATGGQGKLTSGGSSGGTYKAPSAADIKAAVTPTTPAPAPISRVEEYEKLRTQYNVAELEDYVNSLTGYEQELYDEMLSRTRNERGKPVPLGVIAGRISKVEEQQYERINEVTRLKNTAINELKTKYAVIETYVNLLGLDYEDAKDRYDTEFGQNLQIYNLLFEGQKFEFEQKKYAQQVASANLQTMVNAMLAGNMTYNELDPTQQLMVRKLELEAGLPAGFTSTLKVNPKDKVLFQTSNEGITQIGWLQPDGSVKVESYGTRISSGGSGQPKKSDAISEMSSWLSSKGGEDNFVSSNEWNYAKQLWVQKGFDAGDFDKTFAFKYVGNPYERGWNAALWNLEDQPEEP